MNDLEPGRSFVASSAPGRIPRIIHRIWLDDPMPDVFAAYERRWRDFHPDWSLVTWSRTEDLPVLHNQDLFDQAETIYPNDWKRFQADVLRLELLWLYGGLYVDTDTHPLRAIDQLLKEPYCLTARSPQQIKGVHPITNAAMAAIPHHPWVGALIQTLPDAVRQYGHLSLAQSVGPWHLTRTYDACDWPTVTVLEHDELYGSWLSHDWNTAARKRGKGVW